MRRYEVPVLWAPIPLRAYVTEVPMLVNFFPETRNLKKCQRLLETNLFFFILDFLPPALYNRCVVRRVAQFGRALRSGRRGRGFESRHADFCLLMSIE